VAANLLRCPAIVGDERPRRTFWVLPGPPTIKRANGDAAPPAHEDRGPSLALIPNDGLVIARQQFVLLRHNPPSAQWEQTVRKKRDLRTVGLQPVPKSLSFQALAEDRPTTVNRTVEVFASEGDRLECKPLQGSLALERAE
jgi:hypothetical protein